MTRGLRWLRERILFTDEMEVASWMQLRLGPADRECWAGRDRVLFITV